MVAILIDKWLSWFDWLNILWNIVEVYVGIIFIDGKGALKDQQAKEGKSAVKRQWRSKDVMEKKQQGKEGKSAMKRQQRSKDVMEKEQQAAKEGKVCKSKDKGTTNPLMV